MLKPLDDTNAVVQLIADVCGTTREEARRRLLDEANEIGTNVFNAMKADDIPMYVTSDKLTRFYEETDAFLYETTIWNCCDAKQKMRDFVTSRLQQFGHSESRIFCCGDGLGFDSTWLALQGHNLSYFEPSLRCQQYARAVFDANQASVEMLSSLDEIQPGSLDAIVCLDVLEHVPEPQNMVQQFATWLKPDGLLFAHAPFWCIHWTRSTHLKENRRYSGDLKQVYQSNGFHALDASVFWDPIVFQRADQPIARTSPGAKLRIRLGKLLLTSGRWDDTVHTWIARKIARAPKQWVRSLAEQV